MKTVALVLSVAVVAWAAPQDSYNYQAPAVQQPQYPDAPALYNFQWDINDDYSGNFYGHQEQRDGDNTQGSYYVRLPDTRLMKVQYYVDDNGFHPIVTFEGEAQYPSAPSRVYSQPAPAPQQTYQQPAPQQTYQQPAPQQTYQQPGPTPSQFYSQPGK
ncbi:cuticle protein 19-like [Homarus americanus]|uniref:cuticle protein 19-like n=1 Tax=Homarus americanus TaxID=6706 RepID=UPI001C492C0A|nr:cuticle protein 19-like [Homarus americanus]